MKENMYMEFFFQLLGIIVGILFPIFLIKAIKTESKEKTSEYTALASITFGFIIFVLIASIN